VEAGPEARAAVALVLERVAPRVAEWVAMREAKRVAPGVAVVLEKAAARVVEAWSSSQCNCS